MASSPTRIKSLSRILEALEARAAPIRRRWRVIVQGGRMDEPRPEGEVLASRRSARARRAGGAAGCADVGRLDHRP
jgi:hypothetical protein